MVDLRDSVARAYSRPCVEECGEPTGVVGLRHAEQILLVLGIGLPTHSTDLGQSSRIYTHVSSEYTPMSPLLLPQTRPDLPQDRSKCRR